MEGLHKIGHNHAMIANVLAIHKSTISRELKRNRSLRDYRPKQAHKTAMQRRNEKPRTHIALTTWVVVNAQIKQDCNPEQTSSPLLMKQGISSAINGFIFMPTKINAREVICTAHALPENVA